MESLHIPCKLTFSIHIHLYIHMDIIECVHTLYLHSCLYQYGYYRMWSVSTFHVELESIKMYVPYSVFTFIYYYWKWAIIWNMDCGSTLHINFTYKYRFQPKKNNISYFKRIPLIWHNMGNTMTLPFFLHYMYQH